MDEIFEALEELKNYLFNEWTQNHVNVGCDYKLEAELEKQIKNLNAIKQALLKTQEQGNVLNWIIKHLSFEDGGTAIIKDFITGKEETKHIIKVKSKDTDATINILLDTKEFDTFKENL